jgi:hypothetical protein
MGRKIAERQEMFDAALGRSLAEGAVKARGVRTQFSHVA